MVQFSGAQAIFNIPIANDQNLCSPFAPPFEVYILTQCSIIQKVRGGYLVYSDIFSSMFFLETDVFFDQGRTLYIYNRPYPSTYYAILTDQTYTYTNMSGYKQSVNHLILINTRAAKFGEPFDSISLDNHAIKKAQKLYNKFLKRR